MKVDKLWVKKFFFLFFANFFLMFLTKHCIMWPPVGLKIFEMFFRSNPSKSLLFFSWKGESSILTVLCPEIVPKLVLNFYVFSSTFWNSISTEYFSRKFAVDVIVSIHSKYNLNIFQKFKDSNNITRIFRSSHPICHKHIRTFTSSSSTVANILAVKLD